MAPQVWTVTFDDTITMPNNGPLHLMTLLEWKDTSDYTIDMNNHMSHVIINYTLMLTVSHVTHNTTIQTVSYTLWHY